MRAYFYDSQEDGELRKKGGRGVDLAFCFCTYILT